MAADGIAVFLLWVWCSEFAGPWGSDWMGRTTFIGTSLLSPTAFLILRYGFGLGHGKSSHWFAALGIAWIAPFALMMLMKLLTSPKA
jgi:hypothetical protein